MAWWGKLAGGAFGLMFGGPLGALLGVTLGHQFDKGLKAQHGAADLHERTQAAFFTATFAVMGRVAKSDGRISESEIAHARRTMAEMLLDEEQQKAAIELFHAGKRPDFDLDAVLDQFRAECRRSTNLIRFFLEIQIMTAIADGVIDAGERELLVHVAERLGISRALFERLLHLSEGLRGAPDATREDRLAEAHALLGVAKSASDAEVKKAYRRLMNQHHPDKLVARGMPEEMVTLANAKSREIREAYELARAARKG